MANDRASEAFELFQQLIIPIDDYLLATAFKICANLTDEESLKFGENLLQTLPIKYQENTIILTSALHMLMQRKQIHQGEQLFCRMTKNVITNNTMMSGM